MAITILQMGRPNSILMKAKPTSSKKENYVRKGSWDWTGLSKEEMRADLLEAIKRADEEYKNGDYKLAKDLYEEWAKEHRGCAITE